MLVRPSTAKAAGIGVAGVERSESPLPCLTPPPGGAAARPAGPSMSSPPSPGPRQGGAVAGCGEKLPPPLKIYNF